MEGFKSSEFVATVAALALIANYAPRLGWGGCLGLAVAAGLYAISRGLAKGGKA